MIQVEWIYDNNGDDMKNEKIHDGLDDSGIRDYLSKQLRKEISSAEYNTDSVYINNEIIKLQTRIKKMEDMLSHAIEVSAIELLIGKQGWKRFDISDYVEFETETYFYFVGTEKEFDELISKTTKIAWYKLNEFIMMWCK